MSTSLPVGDRDADQRSASSPTIPQSTTGPFGITIAANPTNQGDELPYAYYEPTSDGKTTWHCGVDAEGKIISIFSHDFGTSKDRKIAVITKKDADYARDELIKAGWRRLDPPKITTTYPGESKPRELTRKQKRFLQQKLRKMSKSNPFATEKDVEVPEDKDIADGDVEGEADAGQ